MNVVFFGTPDFAVASIEAIVNSKHTVVGVVTAPDKPAGRGFKLQHSPVKEFAVKHHLHVLQPTNLKDTHFINALQSLNAHIFVVVAFRMLPQVVWQMPPQGTFNLHASLLPKYRGAAPINWALINGETETGVTTFFLKHEIDTGSIIYQEKIAIKSSDNFGTLYTTLKNTGSQLVIKTIQAIENKIIKTINQEDLIEKGISACEAPKLTKTTGHINFNNTASQIHNLVRGLSPYPGAYFTLEIGNHDQKTIKIFETQIAENLNLLPGEIRIIDSKIAIGAKNSAIFILEIQMEGKKRMKTPDFLRGNNLINCKISAKNLENVA